MRWTQLIFASGGMLTGLSGWAGDAAISRPVDAPQGPDFHLKYEKYSFFGVRSEEIAFELEKIRFGSADVEIMPFVIKALPDANSRNYSLPVGVPGTQNPPKKLILPLSKSGSSLAAMGLRKRAYSTGGMQAGFCSSTPDFKIQSMSTGATALAGPGSTLKIPLPVHNPIDGAFVINPREAAKRLGDDMAEGLAWFLRQALPGIEEADFHTTAERTQLAIHYRSTYGQMEPVRKPNRPVRYVGIGHAGSIGDTFRQMRSMGAESLSESEKGEGAIGGHIEDSNFFTHMRNTRRFLGRQENNRDFLMDYRETLYEHGRYSIPAQQLQMQQFEVLVQELLEIVQTVTAANPHLNVDFSSIQYEQLLHVEGSGIITVNAVPPEWINYFIQALLYDWYKSFNSITNQDQLLDKMAKFGAMFMFIRPFPECNELTLINMFKMTIDLLLSMNSNQLDFNSLVFSGKSTVASPVFAQMLQSLLNARVRRGSIVHVSPVDYGPHAMENLHPNDPDEEDSVPENEESSIAEEVPSGPAGDVIRNESEPMKRTDQGDILI